MCGCVEGGGAEVPVYLRYEGNLKNLHLQKADVHRVIREAWKEKVTEDEKVNHHVLLNLLH